MKPINYNQYRSARSFNSRIRFLVLHYTATNFSSSVSALTGPNVSAHYLVPDITDPSYLKAGYTGQEVFNLVDEGQRAWHAGVSQWGNRGNLNDTSIGIEVVNLATGEGTASYRFTAANGDDVLLTFVLLAIPTSPTAFSIEGVWQVTGGTGRFEGASGSGTYVGQAEFVGPADAVGTFALEGTISSPNRLE